MEVLRGDLLHQRVEVIVNAWNRNVIPWWLLLPQGVSGAIRRRAGYAPFRELGRLGPIPLGGAVLTGAGRLPFRAIVHVAGIDQLWRSSERSIRDSGRNALALAGEHGFRSIAFPVIGAGSGGMGEARAFGILADEISRTGYPGRVVVVRYGPAATSRPAATETDDFASRYQPITIAEAEAAHLVQVDELGPDPVPFGFMNTKWKAMLAEMQPGDGLFTYRTSPESWNALAGREGIFLVRDGKVIRSLVTMMS